MKISVPPHKAGLTPTRMGCWVGLLLMPGLALLSLRTQVDGRWLFAYLVLISSLTFFTYRHDKARAQAKGWRVPETTLHLLELLGGWPGAFLAQRLYWHKVSKVSFRVVFWLIVAAYQYVAADYLQHWRFSREAWSLLLKAKGEASL